MCTWSSTACGGSFHFRHYIDRGAPAEEGSAFPGPRPTLPRATTWNGFTSDWRRVRPSLRGFVPDSQNADNRGGWDDASSSERFAC